MDIHEEFLFISEIHSQGLTIPYLNFLYFFGISPLNINHSAIAAANISISNGLKIDADDRLVELEVQRLHHAVRMNAINAARQLKHKKYRRPDPRQMFYLFGSNACRQH